MKAKPIVLREQAGRDSDEAIAHYLSQGAEQAALTRYPHLVFYIDRDDHIDLWRVLHGERDIPPGCTSPDRI